MFADESNVHTMEFFDEAQTVKWFASVSVGVLVHTGGLEKEIEEAEGEKKGNTGLGFPIIGPACNSSCHIVGWHAFGTLNYTGMSRVLKVVPGLDHSHRIILVP